jgi:hypothetical protein
LIEEPRPEKEGRHWSDLRSLMACFDPRGAAAFGIDQVQLRLSPREGLIAEGSRSPTPAATTRLNSSKTVTRQPRCWAETYSYPHLTVLQRLGSYRGGNGDLFAFVKVNPLRNLRARLISDGTLHDRHLKPSHQLSNFVPPDAVPGIDFHTKCLDELWSAFDEAREAYREVFADVFGRGLETDEISIAISQVELTWDRPCMIGRFAVGSGAMWAAWRDAHRGAAEGVGHDDEGSGGAWSLTRQEATELREAQAAPGAMVLRANGLKGDCAKLYAKTHHHLRFEAELTAKRASKILGHRIGTDSLVNLTADLERLAKRPYERLLQTQANLTSPVLNLAELVLRFLPPRRSHAVERLLTALLSGGKFKHQNGAFEDLLGRLKKSGTAKHRGSGYWALAGEASRTVQQLGQYLEWRARRTR